MHTGKYDDWNTNSYLIRVRLTICYLQYLVTCLKINQAKYYVLHTCTIGCLSKRVTIPTSSCTWLAVFALMSAICL